MKTSCTCLFVIHLLLIAAKLQAATAQPPLATPDPAQAGPTFRREVLPIFLTKCVRCHNNQTRMLPNWVDYQTAVADRVEIRRRVWDSWKGHYFKQPMPAGNSAESLTITTAERELIKRWVDDGAPYGQSSRSATANSKAERIVQGQQIFATICAACHQPTGLGLPDQFPPLAGSDFLNADKNRAINIVLHGLQGEVTVNGKTFNNSMPQLPLTDQEIANALTYVYNSFGNSGLEVTVPEVARQRRMNTSPTFAGPPGRRSSQPATPTPFE